MGSPEQISARYELPSGPVMFLAEVIASAISEQVTTGDDESRNGVWWLSGGCTPGSAGCVELNPALIADLQTNVGDDVVCGDFLNIHPSELLGWPFDRVVMNPPFSKQQDARHVLHAASLLKPGGRLVSIMSAAVKFRETEAYRAVRELVDRNLGVCEALPEGSFKESGTGVNTALVSFTLGDR